MSKARLDALFAVLCRALMESSIGAKRIHEYMMIPVNFSLMRAVRDGGGQMFALFHMRDAIFTPDGVARWEKGRRKRVEARRPRQGGEQRKKEEGEGRK